MAGQKKKSELSQRSEAEIDDGSRAIVEKLTLEIGTKDFP